MKTIIKGSVFIIFCCSQSSDNVTTLGIAILENMDIPTQRRWFWIGVVSLLGFAVLFNILFTFVLMYFDRKFPLRNCFFKNF